MGVTFIGNPLGQDNDANDSDWEINGEEEEWVTPPAEIALYNMLRPDDFNVMQGNLIITAQTSSGEDDDDSDWLGSNELEDENDEDYNPDDEDYEEDEEIDDLLTEQDAEFYFDENDDIDEDLDYVTFPIPEEHPTPVANGVSPSEADKSTEETADAGSRNDVE